MNDGKGYCSKCKKFHYLSDCWAEKMDRMECQWQSLLKEKHKEINRLREDYLKLASQYDELLKSRTEPK